MSVFPCEGRKNTQGSGNARIDREVQLENTSSNCFSKVLPDAISITKAMQMWNALVGREEETNIFKKLNVSCSCRT